MKNTYRIAEIHLGAAQDFSDGDAYYRFDFLQKNFELQRYSAFGCIELLKTLIVQLCHDVDAIAISGFEHLELSLRDQVLEVIDSDSLIPICDGQSLRLLFTKVPAELNYFSGISVASLDALSRLYFGRITSLSTVEWDLFLKNKWPQINRPALHPPVHKTSPTTRLVHQVQHSVKRIMRRQQQQKKYDFAFVVHALSHRDFTRLPGMKVLHFLPEKWNDHFDRGIAKLPPVVFGEINHVISECNGREINGLVYGLFATPKVLKESKPEVIYQKLLDISVDARERGARIMGLGAYTKTIGDQGLTINQSSPIPVTTGNSLSASATLWGLYDILERLQHLQIDQNGHYTAMAMVVGATGSIGKVSAKLLSQKFKKIFLVAPRLERLKELQAEIYILSPHCEVQISTEANAVAHLADVLVTATTSFEHKIIDVAQLKKGCVVCDCSRPLDFDRQDVLSRPDVLIMESGEVHLPGPVAVNCDLKLPGNTVYACLAETALLALEERYEAFTMGRDIEWDRVVEIHQLARKHGIRLSAIQGPIGLITPSDLARFKSQL